MPHGKFVPTSEALARADARFALAYWPWSLLAPPEPLPEQLVAAAPHTIVDHTHSHWRSTEHLPDDVRDAYVAALRDVETVHTVCQDYRAAISLDVEHDEDDRPTGRRIACPTLVLWAAAGPIDHWYDEDAR